MTTQTIDTITRALGFADSEEEITPQATQAAYLEIRPLWENRNRIEAAPSLLDSPVPGMRVEGEGFCWEYNFAGNVCDWFANPLDSYVQRHSDVLPVLKAAVRGGATVSLPGEGEA